ncbi:MAG: hypothetical protein PVF43_09885 [Candidatus Eiseniibacteriota bacterium]
MSDPHEAREDCPRCGGSGTVGTVACPLCHGAGFLAFQVAQLAEGYRSLIRNAMIRHVEVLDAAEAGKIDKSAYFREIRLLAGTLEEHGFSPLEILTMPQKYLRMMVARWTEEAGSDAGSSEETAAGDRGEENPAHREAGGAGEAGPPSS